MVQTKYFIGTQLRKIRLQRDWQQKDICDLLSLSQSKYSSIENNHKSLSDIELDDFAEKLQVEKLHLITDEYLNVFNNFAHAEHSIAYNRVNYIQHVEDIKNLYERLLEEQRERYESEIRLLRSHFGSAQ